MRPQIKKNFIPLEYKGSIENPCKQPGEAHVVLTETEHAVEGEHLEKPKLDSEDIVDTSQSQPLLGSQNDEDSYRFRIGYTCS